MIRSKLTRRRIVALAVLAVGGGVAVAQSAGGSGPPARPARPTAPAPAPAPAPAVPPPRPGEVRVLPGAAITVPTADVLPIGLCPPRRGAVRGALPSQALLDAFGILRRDRTPEDELTAAALRALKQRGLEPVAPDAARLLRAAGDARAWVVPVPDIDRANPFACRRGRAARDPREGVAVVSIGGAPAGGGGALHDLVRGIAPVAVDPCAGQRRNMLGVSGIVPDGIGAVFLTAPDGTAVRADVKDNAFAFVVPRGRRPEPRFVVWNGSDGTPHVQPVLTVLAPAIACRLPLELPVVTPTGASACTVLPMLSPTPSARRPRPSSASPARRALPRSAVAAGQRARQRARQRRRVPPIALSPRMPGFLTEPCATGLALRLVLPKQIPSRAIPAPPRPAPLPAKPRREHGP